MSALLRTALLVCLAAAVAVGGTAGVAVAGTHAGSGDGGPSNGTNGNGGHGGQQADDGNSTLDLHSSAGAAGNGGWLVIDCTSDGPPDHECDKGGALTIGPVTIDYDGFNFGDVDSMRGGGGDNVTVSDGDRTVGGGFACDQGLTAPSGAPCSVSSTGP